MVGKLSWARQTRGNSKGRRRRHKALKRAPPEGGPPKPEAVRMEEGPRAAVGAIEQPRAPLIDVTWCFPAPEKKKSCWGWVVGVDQSIAGPPWAPTIPSTTTPSFK